MHLSCPHLRTSAHQPPGSEKVRTLFRSFLGLPQLLNRSIFYNADPFQRNFADTSQNTPLSAPLLAASQYRILMTGPLPSPTTFKQNSAAPPARLPYRPQTLFSHLQCILCDPQESRHSSASSKLPTLFPFEILRLPSGERYTVSSQPLASSPSNLKGTG